MTNPTFAAFVALAILFGVPLLILAAIAIVVQIMQSPRRAAEADLEEAMVCGDVERVKAILLVRGELLSLDALEEAQRWIEEQGEEQ